MLIGETAHETPEAMKPPFFCINASLELGSAINKIKESYEKRAICCVKIPNVLPFGDADEEIEYVDAYGNKLLMYGLEDAEDVLDSIAGSTGAWLSASAILSAMDANYEWYGKRGVVFYCK